MILEKKNLDKAHDVDGPKFFPLIFRYTEYILFARGEFLLVLRTPSQLLTECATMKQPCYAGRAEINSSHN